MEVSRLEGALLDYWVAKAEGLDPVIVNDQDGIARCTIGYFEPYSPSVEWTLGGPIIQREQFTLLDPKFCESGLWEAFMGAFPDVAKYSIVGMVAQGAGPTPLIAAMRAYVSSKFGDEVRDA